MEVSEYSWIIGVIFGLVIIIILAMLFFGWKKKKREYQYIEPIPYYHDTLVLDSFEKMSHDTKREIDRCLFDVGEEIGSGNFGKVFVGKLHELYGPASNTAVAIKTAHGTANENAIHDLLLEIKLLSYIDAHPNLVSMIGSCVSELKSTGKVWLIIEFCDFGDLKTYLKENKHKLLQDNESDSLNSRCLLKWSHGIAKGMQHLEESKIMHGDLAARNILMSKDILGGECPIAKVADFGLAKKLYETNYQKTSRLLVPWKWMAPEFLTDDIFTLKSDVWSFAVLFWEILSFGQNPYGRQEYEEVLTKLKSGYRLPYPIDTKNVTSWHPEEMYSAVTQRCFEEDPDKRANFNEVLKLIEDTLTEAEKSYYAQMIATYESDYSSNYIKIGDSSS